MAIFKQVRPGVFDLIAGTDDFFEQLKQHGSAFATNAANGEAIEIQRSGSRYTLSERPRQTGTSRSDNSEDWLTVAATARQLLKIDKIIIDLHMAPYRWQLKRISQRIILYHKHLAIGITHEHQLVSFPDVDCAPHRSDIVVNEMQKQFLSTNFLLRQLIAVNQSPPQKTLRIAGNE